MHGVELGDLDGDGDLDAFTTSVGSYGPSPCVVWPNDGHGVLTDSHQRFGYESSRGIALADFDGDGALDALTDRSLWLNGNLPPTISALSEIVVLKGQKSDLIAFSISDAESAAESLALTAKSSNTSLLPDSGIKLSGTGAERALVLQPNPNVLGTVQVTISVSDGLATTSRSFGVSVRDASDVLTLEQVLPAPNNAAAPSLAPVSLAFNDPIDSRTVSSSSLTVCAMQSGGLLSPPNPILVSGPAVSLRPAKRFKPGEPVAVTLTTEVLSTAGKRLTKPFVWQFLATVDDGSGNFTQSPQKLGSGYAVDVAVGDMNGDGFLDIVELNSGPSPSASLLWLNDGHGAFAQGIPVLTNFLANRIRLGDLNGDGALDALVTATPGVSVYLGDGHGRLSDTGQLLGGTFFGDSALIDVDGDGDLDAVVATGAPSSTGVARVLFNAGDGGLSAGPFFGGGGRLAAGDLDRDGDLDVVLGGTRWLNDGKGGFVDGGVIIKAASRPDGVAPVFQGLADLNGDGHLDAFFCDDKHIGEVWTNNGTGGYLDSGKRFGHFPSASVPSVADFDADGDLDLLISQRITYPLVAAGLSEVWLNTGTGGFTDSGHYLTIGTDKPAAAGDLNGDGTVDLAFALQVTADGRVWLNATRPPTILLPNALPDGVVGADYDLHLEATGGLPPYTWSVVDGILPLGLALDASHAQISGKPATQSVSTFSLRVVASDGQSVQRPFQLSVVPPAPVAPSVSIKVVTNSPGAYAPATVTIAVVVTDASTKIKKAELFDASARLAEDLVAPFEFVRRELPEGSYRFYVRATDERGGVGISDMAYLRVRPAPPENDSFGQRNHLSGASSIVFASNERATLDPGEPSGFSGGASVWWAWTAPANAPVSISVEDTEFTAALSVYRGDTLDQLALVAANSSGPGGTASRVVFDAVANTAYQVAVDGLGGASGPFTLRVEMLTAKIQVTGAGVRLSWPAWMSGAAVEFTERISDRSAWQRMQQPLVREADQVTITVPISQQARFYRLTR